VLPAEGRSGVILRDLGAALGALLVVLAGASVVGTVVVARPVRSWLTGLVAWIVDGLFLALARLVRDAKRRDAVLAVQAPAALILQLGVWLTTFLVGFALVLLPLTSGSFSGDLTESGSDMSTIGFAVPHNGGERAVAILAAFIALGTVALQIGYLPALYAAYNRRETTVALLTARAGVPSWGPELLARTHYGLGTGISTVGTLADLYSEWERWAADVTESHTTYLPLVWFRSPRPLTSWVTALLGVLDSAALFLALSPSSAPEIPARLCLRGGFICFNRIATAMGIAVEEEVGPEEGTTLTFEEFLDAVERLRRVEFPIERKPEEAWPHFVGWRVNYERAAYAIADAVFAPPALWSGPRRVPVTPIAPLRPPDLHVPGKDLPGPPGGRGSPAPPGR
jgi:hypothetical protein